VSKSEPLLLTDVWNQTLRLTAERWAHILSHPEHDDRARDWIEATVAGPDRIVRSRTDPSVELFYRHYDRTPVTSKHLCVVAKTRTDAPFIITAYFTDAVKQGEELWSRPSGP
jgi:hypothetical protein